MSDQKWNKNALNYGESNQENAADKWNKNALNYDNDKRDTKKKLKNDQEIINQINESINNLWVRSINKSINKSVD